MRSIRTLLVAAWALAVPLNLAQADQLESQDFSKNPLASQIEYYNKFGFPKAGRSLKQKIQEAEGFLNTDLPATTSVGVGFAVVYDDHAVITKGYGVRSTTDSKSLVIPDSLFEIGSVTKTMIAVAIGLLVQDGKLKWTDYAKTHLPWLKLKDPYAEQYVTIGNLLSMNSGFGRTPDFAWSIAYDDEKSFVEALASVDPESSLRETPMYGNANFEILGQVIHEVSGKPWYELLRDRVWIPLGMKNTFGSPRAVPATLMNTTMNQGHLTCGKNVLGPYNVAKEGALLQNSTMKYAAAGSVVSSVSDMTKFVRLMLNKGKVDGVVIFNDTRIITEITTGKNEVTFDASSIARGGGSVAAGYGVDIIGDLMWTRPYYSKNGGTSFHESDTVYTPIDGIGIVWLSNSVSVGDVTRIRLEQAAIYVTGIFLDIPKPILDYVLKKQREAIPKPASPFPGVPECGFSFWKNPPHVSVDNATRQAIVGTYYPATNPQFNPTLSIEQGASSSEFRYRVGVISGSASVAGNVSSTWLFATKDVLGLSAISAEQDAQGQFTIDFGVLYRKSWEQ